MKFYRIRRADGKYFSSDYYGGWDVPAVAKIFRSKAGVTICIKGLTRSEIPFDTSRYTIERCELQVEESIPLEDW